MAGERKVKKMKDWIGVHELVTYSTMRKNRAMPILLTYAA